MSRLRLVPPQWSHILLSALVLLLGFGAARHLTLLERDLRALSAESTLAAVDLSQLTGGLLRYRTTIFCVLCASDRAAVEQAIRSIPEQRVLLQQAVVRYVSGRDQLASPPEQYDALLRLQVGLEDYFSQVARTLTLLNEAWDLGQAKPSRQLRREARRHYAKVAGLVLTDIDQTLNSLLAQVPTPSSPAWRVPLRPLRMLPVLLMAGSLLLAGLIVVRRPRRNRPVGPPLSPGLLVC